jgi:hypothetical protein
MSFEARGELKKLSAEVKIALLLSRYYPLRRRRIQKEKEGNVME